MIFPRIDKTEAGYPDLRARYSKGTLKLNRRLQLLEGAEVRVSVTSVRPAARQRKPTRRRYAYPSRSFSPANSGV